jgi:hypothetical protein
MADPQYHQTTTPFGSPPYSPQEGTISPPQAGGGNINSPPSFPQQQQWFSQDPSAPTTHHSNMLHGAYNPTTLLAAVQPSVNNTSQPPFYSNLQQQGAVVPSVISPQHDAWGQQFSPSNAMQPSSYQQGGVQMMPSVSSPPSSSVVGMMPQQSLLQHHQHSSQGYPYGGQFSSPGVAFPSPMGSNAIDMYALQQQQQQLQYSMPLQHTSTLETAQYAAAVPQKRQRTDDGLQSNQHQTTTQRQVGVEHQHSSMPQQYYVNQLNQFTSAMHQESSTAATTAQVNPMTTMLQSGVMDQTMLQLQAYQYLLQQQQQQMALSTAAISPQLPPSGMPDPARYKTRLCKNYAQNGHCVHGNTCQFAHGNTELRSNAWIGNRSDSSRYKTTLCRNFMNEGKCPYEAVCQFAHGVGELRSRTDESR